MTRRFKNCEKCHTDDEEHFIEWCPGGRRKCGSLCQEVVEHFHVMCTICGFEWMEPIGVGMPSSVIVKAEEQN